MMRIRRKRYRAHRHNEGRTMNTIVVFYIVLVTRLIECCSNVRRQAGMVYIEGHWQNGSL